MDLSRKLDDNYMGLSTQRQRPIGYYVHHHGDGHRQRALAISKYCPERFILLGSKLKGRTQGIDCIDLSDDRLNDTFDGLDRQAHRPDAFHYAPLGHPGVQSRMTTISNWIAKARPSLMVVDVSVEVALLARLCSVPVAFMRLAGVRCDQPHLEAFRSASFLVAPFAKALDEPNLPDWISDKTIYAPGLALSCPDAPPIENTVLVVCGRGGSTISAQNIVDAANAHPELRWKAIGLTAEDRPVPPNVTFEEWTDYPEREIACAEMVIGSAGDGTVSTVLATGRPFVCIPEHRPFNEQVSKATALAKVGAAIVLERWPHTSEWNDIFKSALAIDRPVPMSLHDPDGARRLCQRLLQFN